MKVNVEIRGLKSTIDKFKQFGKEGLSVVEDVTGNVANEVTAEAKRNAPVDLGKLKQSISKRSEDDYNHVVEALESYAPYQEFGTGGLVDIQPGWEDMAAQFKGKGIKQVNIPPQPFMFPAYLKGKAIFKNDLEAQLNALVKKYE